MTLVQEAMSIMERMPRRNQQIVLDLLRAMSSSRSDFDEQSELNADTKMRTAALGLAGLWKDHENELPVEKTVRNMRKGRLFDT